MLSARVYETIGGGAFGSPGGARWRREGWLAIDTLLLGRLRLRVPLRRRGRHRLSDLFLTLPHLLCNRHETDVDSGMGQKLQIDDEELGFGSTRQLGSRYAKLQHEEELRILEVVRFLQW